MIIFPFVSLVSSAGGSSLLRRSPRSRWLSGLGLAAGLALTSTAMAESNVVALGGTWRFRLDPQHAGVENKWFAQTLDDSLTLPGTTDTNKKGEFKDERALDRLSRVWYWKGPAWYQRDVDIPASWQGKRITLLLERTKTTGVWIDQTYCGGDDTLSAYQVFDLSKAASPGKHTLTVLVDNAKLPPVGPSHAVDERTQTNWNGIIGRIELRATDPVWLDDVQVFPNAAKKQATVRAMIGNITGKPVAGRIVVACKSYNVATPATFKAHAVEFHADGQETTTEFVYQPGDDVPLWDEFQPAMLHLDLTLETRANDHAYRDQRAVEFGMRDFTTFRNQLLVNGRPVFLRGRVDCCNYPLTGYPPLDKAGWRRVLGILKDWGLNHVRFHSWCPPEAAFAAADELGFYFQAELPNKSSRFNAPESKEAAIHNIDWLDPANPGGSKPLYEYARREAELIFKDFGNHPSFVMFTLGNELGRNEAMFDLVAWFKQTDPRHLYAQGSGNMHWAPSLAEGDQFWVTNKTAKDMPVRGAFYRNDYKGYIEFTPPSTLTNYSRSIAGIPVPLVSHEIGEPEVSPDFSEIPKYTGVLRARNLEVFRERLDKAGMLDQAADFVKASGALSAISYREEIEAALRTPGMGGFHLLDIQDFPGQGTALVGMLNTLMESKGIIEPAKWREFCSETVPLLGMKKYTWTTEETFTGRVQVAHHGPAAIPGARVTWTVADHQGGKLAAGALGPVTIAPGSLCDVDLFAFPLHNIAAPQRINITLAIDGTSYRNIYPLWIYPAKIDTAAAKGVQIADTFMAPATREHLRNGGKVLLLPKLDRLPHSIAGAFQTDFWSPMFAESARKRGLEPPPGTLGILCDPNTPALARFPTEFHTNWQWWHLVKNSRPVILDDTPAGYRPTVQVIDNFARNYKLGLIVETKVGKGSMLVCAIDLLGQLDQPEARQLLHSLLRYVESPAFAPTAELPAELLGKLFP